MAARPPDSCPPTPASPFREESGISPQRTSTHFRAGPLLNPAGSLADSVNNRAFVSGPVCRQPPLNHRLQSRPQTNRRTGRTLRKQARMHHIGLVRGSRTNSAWTRKSCAEAPSGYLRPTHTLHIFALPTPAPTGLERTGETRKDIQPGPKPVQGPKLVFRNSLQPLDTVQTQARFTCIKVDVKRAALPPNPLAEHVQGALSRHTDPSPSDQALPESPLSQDPPPIQNREGEAQRPVTRVSAVRDKELLSQQVAVRRHPFQATRVPKKQVPKKQAEDHSHSLPSSQHCQVQPFALKFHRPQHQPLWSERKQEPASNRGPKILEGPRFLPGKGLASICLAESGRAPK